MAAASQSSEDGFSVGTLTDPNLCELFAAETAAPAVHFPGYAAEHVSGWSEAFAELTLRPYSVTEHDPAGPAFFHGPNLYDTSPVADGKTDYSTYFNQADEAREQLARIMSERGLPHPLDDVLVPLMSTLSPGTVSLATEPDGQRYFAGVVRATEHGIHHHVDDTPLEAPGLAVAETIGQLSAIVYTETPSDGSGALQVFHKRPTKIDYAWNKHPAYGFTANTVRNTPVTTIRPNPGDVVLFDAWSIHQVDPSTPGSRRVTISTFFGLLETGRMIMWS